MTTTILLVRHGDTDAVGTLLAGWKPGWHLNTKGREQVSNLAQSLSRLPIETIYTSPLERAVETAEAIAMPHSVAPSVREDLGEFRFGDWEGRTFENLNRDPLWDQFNATRSTVRPPNGELMTEVQIRMSGEIDNLRRKHEGGTIALVSHADPLRSVIARYLDLSLDRILRFEISPASLSIVRFFGDCPSVLCVNRTSEILI
jgi:probable phosphoglycerate mutase